MLELNNLKIAILGLGYVGLPLAVEFGKKFDTVGFDIKPERINELISGQDNTLEVVPEELKRATKLTFTTDQDNLRSCNCYIVTVPTPIDKHKRPDLTPLFNASKMIGEVINEGNIVIYESTVYPGATEEDCVPIIEEVSGLKFNCDFFVGYSPERINPGDKNHRVTNILKVTSGSSPESAKLIDDLYKSIITAGTHLTSSIRVAEAAKIIENTQRDINIALVNEFSLIFNKLNIDTLEVLQAAETKWNFLPFRPGLVGGHCIGVDPYYLTHKAAEIGYNPEVILSGRRINDSMGKHIAESVVRLMTKKRIHVVDAKILVMGLAFKENCPDLRNTRVIDIIDTLNEYHASIDVYDPWVSKEEAQLEFGITPLSEVINKSYDAIVIAVSHKEFIQMGQENIIALGKENFVLYDVKSLLPQNLTDGRL